MQTKKTKAKNTKKIKPAPIKSRAVAYKPTKQSWGGAIYIYWLIILFFIAATFYILGRTHPTEVKQKTNTVAEEALLTSDDYFDAAKSSLISGDIDSAIASFTTAIEDGNTAAYTLRGEAYLQAGDLAKALDDFNTAIAYDGTNAVAYYDRALLSMRLEDYNAALNDINNALALAATNETILQQRDLYAKRGQLNLWLKNWEGAIADYTNSLARPEGIVSPNVYAERAEAYTALGNYADAITDYSSAVRVISEQIQTVATMEEREAFAADAMGYFEKSAALNVNLGNAEAAISDLGAALTIASKLNDEETVLRLQTLITGLQTNDNN
ncbi:MAG: tetratricopeptide repeat protein [Alphaproteobacteria bacterium]|nr:tetratricopeptide repeat protein [Alphaproteobacteria bacterium]